MNIETLIAHYQEKFDRELISDDNYTDDNDDTLVDAELAKNFLQDALSEVITQAFLATKIKKEIIYEEDGREDAYRKEGINATLTEVEELQKAFVQGK